MRVATGQNGWRCALLAWRFETGGKTAIGAANAWEGQRTGGATHRGVKQLADSGYGECRGSDRSQGPGAGCLKTSMSLAGLRK